jgi:hypothetical protein
MEIIIIMIVIILQVSGIYSGWKLTGPKSLLDIFICAKCLTYLSVLISTGGNLYYASIAALTAYVLEKIYFEL